MKSVGLLILTMLCLYGTVYASDWSREGEFLIDTNVVNMNSQFNPAVAFDGTNYLVVWEDDRNGNWDIYGARVDQDGNVIDPIAFAISAEPNDQTDPTICFCGADYLVVWSDTRNDSYGDIYAARVNQAGAVLDSSGIAITTADSMQVEPSVAFDGINYLVTWRTLEFARHDICGARVNQNGLLLDTVAFRISSALPAVSYGSPAVAYDGTKYLVAFVKMVVMPGSRPHVVGRLVSLTGDTLTGNILLDEWPYSSTQPSLAFDGTNYLVTWTGVDYSFVWGIYGSRVDQAGNVLNSMVIEADTAYVSFPAVIFDGLNYCVVWQDSCSDSTSWDVCGAVLNTSGIVIESFDVSIQSGDQITPALADGTDNQVLITYSGWTDFINGNPVNRMHVWGKFYPYIGVKEGETSIIEQRHLTATIFRGPLQLPGDKECRVFDITGRAVAPDKIQPGIYFIEIDDKIVQKVVKIR